MQRAAKVTKVRLENKKNFPTKTRPASLGLRAGDLNGDKNALITVESRSGARTWTSSGGSCSVVAPLRLTWIEWIEARWSHFSNRLKETHRNDRNVGCPELEIDHPSNAISWQISPFFLDFSSRVYGSPGSERGRLRMTPHSMCHACCNVPAVATSQPLGSTSRDTWSHLIPHRLGGFNPQ